MSRKLLAMYIEIAVQCERYDYKANGVPETKTLVA